MRPQYIAFRLAACELFHSHVKVKLHQDQIAVLADHALASMASVLGTRIHLDRYCRI